MGSDVETPPVTGAEVEGRAGMAGGEEEDNTRVVLFLPPCHASPAFYLCTGDRWGFYITPHKDGCIGDYDRPTERIDPPRITRVRVENGELLQVTGTSTDNIKGYEFEEVIFIE